MPECHGLVVSDDRDGVANVVDVVLALCSLFVGGEQCPDGQLRNSDRGDCNVVIVVDEVVEVGVSALCVDEKRRVE